MHEKSKCIRGKLKDNSKFKCQACANQQTGILEELGMNRIGLGIQGLNDAIRDCKLQIVCYMFRIPWLIGTAWAVL